jgi:hypothetical protein
MGTKGEGIVGSDVKEENPYSLWTTECLGEEG